jgi:hypothetical protein
VESWLNSRDVGDMPPVLQRSRATMLDHLHTYYRRGIFPRNYDHMGHRPSFIDRHGRVCAVAYLMIKSGHGPLARRVAAEANDAYVRELDLPEFETWAAHSGLSKAELAFIQPSYYCTFHPDQFPYLLYHINGVLSGLLNILYLAASISLVAWLLNGVAVLRQRRDLLAIVLGLVAGCALMEASLLHYQTIQAHAADIQYFMSVKSGLITPPTFAIQFCVEGLNKNSPMLSLLASIVPQNPLAFRNVLLGLGTMTVLLSAMGLTVRKRIAKVEDQPHE